MAAENKEKKPPKKKKKAAKPKETAKKATATPEEKQEKINATEFARRMEISKSRVTRGMAAGIVSKAVKRNGGQWQFFWPAAKIEWDNNSQYEHHPDPTKLDRQTGDISNPEARRHQLARTVKEEFTAQKLQLEFEELRGNLVRVADVKKEAMKTGKRIRDTLLAVPLKVRAQIAEMDDPHEIEQVLTDALIDALKDLKNAFTL